MSPAVTAGSFRSILLRGLLAGLIAGLIAGAFGYLTGESHIDAAIAIEEQATHTATTATGTGTGDHHADELVSRAGQRAGLPLAIALYATAMGGLLATAYAMLRRRLRTPSDARAALELAGAAVLAVVLVPFVKFPANPPGVGNASTIDQRTTSYLALVLIGLVAVWAAVVAAHTVRPGAPEWLPWTAATTAFLAVVAVAYLALPAGVDVPDAFPAELLWRFRLTSLSTQLVLWSALGLTFAALLTGVRGVTPARQVESGSAPL